MEFNLTANCCTTDKQQNTSFFCISELQAKTNYFDDVCIRQHIYAVCLVNIVISLQAIIPMTVKKLSVTNTSKDETPHYHTHDYANVIRRPETY